MRTPGSRSARNGVTARRDEQTITLDGRLYEPIDRGPLYYYDKDGSVKVGGTWGRYRPVDERDGREAP